MVSYWKRVPKEVVELQSLKVFKRHLDPVLGDVIYWFRGYRASAGLMVGLDDLKSLFQSCMFYDYMKFFANCDSVRLLNITSS